MAVKIVLDGLPWSGKRTCGKRLAKYYQLRFLNTGDPYRVIGLRSKGDEAGALIVARTLQMIDLWDPELRSESATKYAQVVARIPGVRSLVNNWTREITAGDRGWVLAGQDGARVFGEAMFKFFLLARADERLRRYINYLASCGIKWDLEEARDSLMNRDKGDEGRQISPICYDKDLYDDRIITTWQTEDQTFVRALSICEGKHELLLENAIST